MLIFSEHLDGEDGEGMFRHPCSMGLGHRLEEAHEQVQARLMSRAGSR